MSGVGNQVGPVVEDSRLSDVLARLIPAEARQTDARDAMDAGIAGYLQALDTVPGWFSRLDFRLFVEVDRIQREQSVKGDLFEIGVYCGKSAILMGHLARLSDDQVVICDLFENIDSVGDENRTEIQTWYSGFRQQDFVGQYLRFHSEAPTMIVGPSTEIDAEALTDTCRFIHIDGSHTYDVVRQDIRTAQRMLVPGGIVAFDDISTTHTPGVALAVATTVRKRRRTP